MGLNHLFFKLIRVSIGVQDSLDRIPSPEEWQALYDIAQKQSLVGICFSGVHKLCISNKKYHAGISELLYLQWMGMAAKIQQKNQIVDKQCAELQTKLASDGYRSCVLKGQGVASLYGDNLRGLRQSGDIDIWIEGGIDATVCLANSHGQKTDVTEQHVHLDIFENTEVEAHFTPSILRRPYANRRLQNWFKEKAPLQFIHRNENALCVPTTEFNLVYLLIHIYRHLFGEGVGLRQVMDYYFVLKARNNENVNDDDNCLKTLSSLGLMTFAGALMFVMHEVFGMNRSMMLCEPNEKHGRFLLNEIMLAGNMGYYDKRLKDVKRGTRWQRFCMLNKHNVRLISYYPAETLCTPFTRIKIWAWRKWNGWI